MAQRRSKLTLADLDRGVPSWAQKYRQDFLTVKNKEAEAASVIQSIVDEYPDITDEQLAEIYNSVVQGNEFDVKAIEQEPDLADFSNVTTGIESTEDDAPIPLPSRTVGGFSGGASLGLAQGAMRAPKVVPDAISMARGLAKFLTPEPVRDVLDSDVVGAITPLGAMLYSDRGEDVVDSVSGFFERGIEAAEALKPESYSTRAKSPIIRRDGDGNFEGLSMPSPESAVDTIANFLPQLPSMLAGGGLAAAPMRAAGLSRGLANALGFGISNAAHVTPPQYVETLEEASKQIGANAAFEGRVPTPEEIQRETQVAENKALIAAGLVAPLSLATGTAGAGLSSLLGAGARSMTGAAVRSAAGDVPTEMVEEAGQSAIGDFALGKDVDWLNAAEAGLQAAGSGAVTGAAIGAREYRQGRRDIEDRANRGAEESSRRNRRAPDAAPTQERTPAQEDMFGASSLEGLPTNEEYEAQRRKDLEEEAAWSIRDRKAARLANQEALLASVGRRVDTARQNVEELQERLDDGDTSQGTLNSLSDAVTKQRQAEAEYARQQERLERMQTTLPRAEAEPASEPVQQELPMESAAEKQVANRRERLRQKAEKVEKDTSTKERVDSARRRRELTDKLLTENPDKSDAEILRMVDAQMAAPAEAPKPRRPSRKTPPPVQETRAATSETEDAPSQDEVDALLEKAGIERKAANPNLDMAARTPEQDRKNKTTAREIIRQVTKHSTQTGDDVLNLVAEGRIAMPANPAEVGMEDRGQAGSYDPDTGQMYVFTDRVDPNNIVPTMLEAALHESTHAGQFSEREGRSDPLRAILGDEGYDAANQRIKDLAASGNTLAKDALADAAKTSPDVQNLEAVSYFVGKAAKARASQGGLGRLRTTANDIVASAKDFLRSRTSLDLDVSLADIEWAASRVAGEALASGRQVPVDSTPQMDMVVGEQHPRFEEMKEQGRTFVDRDGKEKTILSDFDSEFNVTPGQVRRLRSGETLPLSDVLSNPNIKGYPELDSTTIRVNPNSFSEAYWDLETNGVVIHPRVLNLLQEGGTGSVHDLILHEVQHGIQGIEGFAKGGSPVQFRTPEERAQVAEHSKNIKEHNRLRQLLRSASISNELDLDRPSRFALRVALQSRKDNVITPAEFVEEVVDTLRNSNSGEPSRHALTTAKELEDNFQAITRSGDRYETLKARTEAEYYALHGEAEANFVQDNRLTRQEDLPTRPDYADRDTTVWMENRDSEGNEAQPQGQLDMAAPEQTEASTPEARVSNKERFRRIKDHSVRGTTAELRGVEDMDTQYNQAYTQDVGAERNPETDKRIMELLTDAENANPQNRQAALEAFASEFPNLSKVLQKAVDKISANSREYVRILVNTGRELTPSQRKDVLTILKNEGRYLTRAFTAFQGQSGRKWAENRYTLGKKNLEKWTKDPSLIRNPQVRGHVEAYAGALNYLNNRFTIPADAELEKMTLAKLEAMYADHMGREPLPEPVGDADQLAARKQFMVDALSRRRETIGPEIYDSMAENAVKELLGLSEATSHTARVLGSMNKDPGTLKKKDFVPDEIRTLLGEITDPAGRIAATLSTQAQLLSRLSLQAELIEDHVGSLVIPPSRVHEPGMSEQFPVPLKGAEYGPLDGYYVKKHVADALRSELDTFYTWKEAMRMFFEGGAGTKKNVTPLAAKVWDSATGALGRINRLQKGTTVIVSPTNWGGNATGSMLTRMRQGDLWRGNARGVGTARDYIASTMTGKASDRLLEVSRYISIEAVDIGEMQRVVGDVIEQYFAGKVPASSVMERIKERIQEDLATDKNVIRTGIATYAMTDTWAKIANFYSRADMLEKYYKAAGENKTRSEILREAGDDTSYTNLSMERVASWAKYGEQRGFTQFLPYFYEVLRTTGTNYNQALLDLERASKTENPEARAIMRNAGIRRLVGNTTASLLWPALMPVATNAGRKALGIGALFAYAVGDDEDQELKRRMVSEFNREQELIPLGPDEDGNAILYPVSQRYDPHGPQTDIVRAAMIHEDPAAAAKSAASTIADLYIKPRWVGKALDAAKAQATGSKVPESRLNRMFPDESEALRNTLSKIGADATTVNNMMYGVESFTFGAMRGLDPLHSPQLSDEQKDTDRGKIIEALRKAGGVFEIIKPEQNLRGYSMESKETQRATRTELNNSVFLPQSISKASVKAAVDNYIAREKARFDEDYLNVQSLRLHGYDDGQIEKFLQVKVQGRSLWSKRDAERLVANTFIPTISLSSLKSAADSMPATMKDQKDSHAERYEQVVEILRELEAEYEDIGLEVSKQ